MDEHQALRLGRFLRTRREHLSLTARQVAAKSGVHDTTVVRLEQGAFRAPRPETLRHIAASLDLSLADVYALADYSPPEDLPALGPYLQATYRELPPASVRRIEKYVRRLVARHAAEAAGASSRGDDVDGQ